MVLSMTASLAAAQDLIYDVIATGTDIPQSTRFAGMGGAGTLFGGDLSSFVINPAGLSMCAPDDVDDFSASWYIGLNGNIRTAENEYYGYKNEIETLFKGDFNFGFTISGPVTFGFAFAKIVDFKMQEMDIYSKNTKNSVATLFNEPYNGYNQRYQNLLTDAEELGIPNTDTHKDSHQSWDDISRQGGIFAFSVPFSFKIAKVLFVGASAGFNYLRSRDTCRLYERGTYSEDFEYRSQGDKTDGYGIAFRGGVIFSPIKYLAVGAAYHHGTKYKIKNRYGYEIFTDNRSSATVHYKSDSLIYRLQTPSKYILSGALILPRFGSFCADMEYTDYTQAKYFSKNGNRRDWDFDNKEIERCYRPAKNYHFGTEIVIDARHSYKLQAAFIRLGYAMYENPYKNIGKDIDHTVMSAGFGFAFENVYWDFAFSYTQTDTQRYLYHQGSVYAPYTFRQNKMEMMVSVKFTPGDFEDFSFDD